jgi:hypothetical protein
VRRAIATLVLLAFVAAAGAPALAMCRRSHDCCCGAAPANVLCAPDCCDRVKAGGAGLNPSADVRQLALAATPAVRAFPPRLTQPAVGRPAGERLVGLHVRAGPRLPLRI